MHLTAELVTSLAPDAASAKAGARLATPKLWRHLGRDDSALWGECQGSALYKVRVRLADNTASCSCPSRKFPCKHSLGLMLLAAQLPDALPQKPPPDWVVEWLDKRRATESRREEKARAGGEAAVATETVKRRKTQSNKAAAARATRVEKGLAGLDLWLGDLVRGGLAGVELQPAHFWEQQAARMVDAQAPGIASRLRAAAGIPNSAPDWPERLLAELGRIALLSEAYSRIDQLDATLAESVRQQVGWSLNEAEVLERGVSVDDTWLVLGERTTQEDRLRVRRTWLLGLETRRAATVVQFAHGNAGFTEVFLGGTTQRATAVYWPGAGAQRALLTNRSSIPQRFKGLLPGAGSVEASLAMVADELAVQPWLEQFVCLLRGVVPVIQDRRWLVVDADRAALPLAPGAHWELLALSGGLGVDLAAVWDGRELSPLGAVSEGRYVVLPEVRA